MADAQAKAAVTTTEVKDDAKARGTVAKQIEERKAAEGTEDSPQPENLGSGKLKAEQPINEFPEYAEEKRGYVKWTDNDGQFHKYPIDGTTAIREPAHEQHDLEVEDRDFLDQASAGKTPRRDNARAQQAMRELHEKNLMNDEVNQDLVKEGVPVEPEEPKEELKDVAVEGDGRFVTKADEEAARSDTALDVSENKTSHWGNRAGPIG